MKLNTPRQNWSFRLYYRGRAGKRDSKLGTGATRKPSVPVVLVTNECFVPIHMLWWGDERIGFTAAAVATEELVVFGNAESDRTQAEVVDRM